MASHSGDLKPIKLLIAPLVIYTSTGLSSFSGPNTSLSPSRYSAILKIQHWAFQIDETCYEVTSVNDDVHARRRVFRLNITSAADWWALRRQAGVQVETFIVGQTGMSEPELKREGSSSWPLDLFQVSGRRDDTADPFSIKLRIELTKGGGL